MLKKWVILLLTTVFVLSACHSPVYNQTIGNAADVKLRAQKARFKSNNDAKTPPPLLVKKGPYVDTTPISLAKQPSWLNNYIVIRGDQLPFSYYSRIIAAGAGRNVLTKFQTGLNPAVNITFNYSGPVRGALDLLATKAGYVYSVRNNSIYWQAFITRTYDIAFMPGASDYMLGKKNQGGGSTTSQSSGSQVQNFVTSDSSDSEYSSLSGKISIWDDIEKSIKTMMSDQGHVTVSQATTSVTIRDRPSNVNLIGQYIANINRTLSRQVLVKIQVLEVQLENDYNFGINWQLIVNAFKNSPFVINGNYGTPVSITPFVTQPTLSGTVPLPAPQFGFNNAQMPIDPNDPTKNIRVPSYTILLNALNQQGHASVVTEPRVVCLNNQVCVVRIVSQEGYVASVQNTTVAGTGGASNNTVTSQITPGNLITGLTLYVLPKVLNGSIYLQVNADLSTKINIRNFTTGGSTVELPSITEKHFNQRSRIHSGDTLILSGMRQVKNTANANQFLTWQALGGKGAQQVNTETIVLITPYVLPWTS